MEVVRLWLAHVFGEAVW